jgi:hypothetical protein
MAKKHMMKCTTSLVMNEIPIKSTLRFHFISVKWLLSITQTTNASEDGGK